MWTTWQRFMCGSSMSICLLWLQCYSIFFFPCSSDQKFQDLRNLSCSKLHPNCQVLMHSLNFNEVVFSNEKKKKRSLIEKFLTSSNPINFTVVAHMLMRAVCVRLLLNLQNTIPRTCILYVVWHRHIWFIFCILKQYYEHFIRLQK